MTERMTDTRTWSIEVLSPLHIGSGDLMSPLDYAVMTGDSARTVVVYDFASLGVTDATGVEQLLRYVKPGTEWSALVQRAKELGAPNPHSAVRYRIPMLTQGAPEDILPFVRNCDDQAYVPGSSLKGAIRTALLYGWALDNEQFFRQLVLDTLNQRWKPDRKEVARGLERRAFGNDPNHDVMRALRVGDSDPVPTEGILRRREAVVRSTRVGSSGEEALRQWLEVVMPKASVRVRISLDRHLFGSQCERQLNFGTWREALEDWPAQCRHFSSVLLERQALMLERLGEKGAEWCRTLKGEIEHDRDGCVIPLGWGVGWESKTVGMLMDDDAFADLKAAYVLGKGKDDPQDYIQGVFPATRWGILMQDGWRPLGWIRLKPA
jgi:CRISPR type III-A-associated RAMP protein Csm5